MALEAVNPLSMENLTDHPGLATVVKKSDPVTVTKSSPSGWHILLHDDRPSLGMGSFGCVSKGVVHFNGQQVSGLSYNEAV